MVVYFRTTHKTNRQNSHQNCGRVSNTKGCNKRKQFYRIQRPRFACIEGLWLGATQSLNQPSSTISQNRLSHRACSSRSYSSKILQVSLETCTQFLNSKGFKMNRSSEVTATNWAHDLCRQRENTLRLLSPRYVAQKHETRSLGVSPQGRKRIEMRTSRIETRMIPLDQVTQNYSHSSKDEKYQTASRVNRSLQREQKVLPEASARLTHFL